MRLVNLSFGLEEPSRRGTRAHACRVRCGRRARSRARFVVNRPMLRWPLLCSRDSRALVTSRTRRRNSSSPTRHSPARQRSRSAARPRRSRLTLARAPGVAGQRGDRAARSTFVRGAGARRKGALDGELRRATIHRRARLVHASGDRSRRGVLRKCRRIRSLGGSRRPGISSATALAGRSDDRRAGSKAVRVVWPWNPRLHHRRARLVQRWGCPL